MEQEIDPEIVKCVRCNLDKEWMEFDAVWGEFGMCGDCLKELEAEDQI